MREECLLFLHSVDFSCLLNVSVLARKKSLKRIEAQLCAKFNNPKIVLRFVVVVAVLLRTMFDFKDSDSLAHLSADELAGLVKEMVATASAEQRKLTAKTLADSMDAVGGFFIPAKSSTLI